MQNQARNMRYWTAAYQCIQTSDFSKNGTLHLLTKKLVEQQENLRSRTCKNRKLFFTLPHLSDTEFFSNQQLVIMPGSALSHCLARNLH